MKSTLVLFLLSCTLLTYAQGGDTLYRDMYKPDSATIAREMENNTRNLNGLVSMMNERKRKEEKQMWLRLGFGIAILGIGAYGLLRKRKTAK